MRIIDALNNAADVYANRTALVFGEKEISFSVLRDQVFTMAKALKYQHIENGDKVGIYLPNCLEYVYSYLAVFSLGAVAVPLDYMLKSDEIISCLSHGEVKLLIAKPKESVDLNVIKSHVPSLERIKFVGIAPGVQVECDKTILSISPGFTPGTVEDTDPALIMYTSGTTGKPKGIVLNYKHLEGSPAAMHHFVDLTHTDVKLCPIPLSHIGGFIYIQNCINFGIKLILMGRFNPFSFLENVQKYNVTCFHIVPPMYNAILTLKQIEAFDLSSLRWVVVFGAPSSPEIMERFHKYCPNAKLLNGWGMTETCPPNTVTPMDSDNIASVGKPAPHCDIKILDEEAKEVSVGQIGEIVIKGWIVMEGYYKDEEETQRMLRPEGLHTGDLGRFDENGFLYIVGRKKEMIKVGGQIVYAPEVEEALHKHEGIAEVAVIGISDKMKGEAVKAFVVFKEGVHLMEQDIKDFCRDHLANFKVPSLIEIRDSLPKNRTGKIDKSALKEEVKEV